MNQQMMLVLDEITRATEQLCAIEPRTFKMLQSKVKLMEKQLLSQTFSSANAQQMVESIVQMMKRLSTATIIKDVNEQWQQLTDNVAKLQKHLALNATLGTKQKINTLPNNLINSLLQSQSSQIKPNLNLPATMHKASASNIQYQPLTQSPNISWRDSKFINTQQGPLSDVVSLQKSVPQQQFKQFISPEAPEVPMQQQSQIQQQMQFQPPPISTNFGYGNQMNPLQKSDLNVNQSHFQPQSPLKQFQSSFAQPVSNELYELKAKLQFNKEDIENQLKQQLDAIQDAFTVETNKINAAIDNCETELYKLKQNNEETMVVTFEALREKIQVLEENFKQNQEVMEQTRKKQDDLLSLGPEIDIILDQLCAIQDKADEYKEMLALQAIQQYDEQLEQKLQQLERRVQEILI